MPPTTLLVRRGYVGVNNVAIAVAIVTIHPYLMTALGLFVGQSEALTSDVGGSEIDEKRSEALGGKFEIEVCCGF